MAYGARLESVLSESSQGFESPILRRSDPSVFKGFRPSRSPVAQLVAQLAPDLMPIDAHFGRILHSTLIAMISRPSLRSTVGNHPAGQIVCG